MTMFSMLTCILTVWMILSSDLIPQKFANVEGRLARVCE